jgi:co-chaperonin GroES (HSP10)
MEVVPLKDKLLVAENERKKETSTTLLDTASGKVLAIGPEVKNIAVGDSIYLNWGKTSLVKIDGAQRVLVAEEDVLAIIR